MEKSKKVEKTNQVKAIKKETEKQSENRVIFNSGTKKNAKLLAWIIAFGASLASIFVFVFGVVTVLKIANTAKADLLNDNFAVTFISNLNGTSINVTQNIIEGYGSKILFTIFNVVIPALAFIAAMVLLTILARKLLDFINENDTEKELYNKRNVPEVEKFACIAEAIITITFVVFDQPSLLLYIFTSSLLFIIIVLFNRCVETKK